MKDIAYQNKDITQKFSAELLKNKSLAVYGLPDIYIKDLLPTNLPAVEANELRMDNLFVLGDDTLALIDYESSFGKRMSSNMQITLPVSSNDMKVIQEKNFRICN